MAIVNRHNDVAALLIEKGANSERRRFGGHDRALCGRGPASARVAHQPADAEADGEIDNLTIVSMLLDRGAKPDARLRLPILPRFHNAGDAQLARGRHAADACGTRRATFR